MNSEAVGNELAAIERLQGLSADWTVILTCGPRLAYQLKPLKACAALVTGHAVLLHTEPLAESDQLRLGEFYGGYRPFAFVAFD